MIHHKEVSRHGQSAGCIFHLRIVHTIPEVIEMDKNKQEQLNQKKSNQFFNSITEKVKPENQNQAHNSRREGMGPNAKRKPS